MPQISTIVSFLREHRLLITAHVDDETRTVDKLAPDGEAGPGCLAWISPKNLARDPQRWRAFKGALLIVPDSIDIDTAPGFGLVLAHQPKLSFIRAAAHFFEHLTTIALPALGAAPIAADARIGQHVRLAAGCVIGPKVRIADHVSIGANTVLAHCDIAEGVRIGCNCSIGLPGFGYEKDENGVYWRFPHTGGVRIERDVEIGSNTCVDRGSLGDTVIGAGSKIDNLVHVAHNVVLGNNTVVIANSMLGGSVTIGEGAWVAPSVTIMNQTNIGAGATLGLGAVVLKDVAPRQVIVGNPGRVLDKNPR